MCCKLLSYLLLFCFGICSRQHVVSFCFQLRSCLNFWFVINFQTCAFEWRRRLSLRCVFHMFFFIIFVLNFHVCLFLFPDFSFSFVFHFNSPTLFFFVFFNIALFFSFVAFFYFKNLKELVCSISLIIWSKIPPAWSKIMTDWQKWMMAWSNSNWLMQISNCCV